MIGYRQWNVLESKLAAQSSKIIWSPGVNVAECRAGTDYFVNSANRKDGSHSAPDADCTCGIYALNKQPAIFTKLDNKVWGQVKLQGKVLLTKSGYRAERATIISLYNTGLTSELMAHIYGVELETPCSTNLF